MWLQLKHICTVSWLCAYPLSFAQVSNPSIADSVITEAPIESKEPRDPMTVNFIFSYYEQDGVHSPVTGGIGDEELRDYVAKVNVTLPLSRKITTTIMGGIDHYTSASTDNINNQFDANTEETSASYVDDRIYGDIGIQYSNEKNRNYFGINGGMSQEWDVRSFNLGGFYAKTSKDQNKQIKFNAIYFHDKWDLIYPTELRKFDGTELLDVSVKELYDLSITGSSIINKRMQASVTLEGVLQTGLLSTPFHRAYFTDTSHNIEILPNTRLKLPVGFHGAYYISNFMILKFYYRYYWDDFGIQAHTAEIEAPLKVHKLVRINPFYRFHTQTAAKYFQPFARHDLDAQFYTSDYDLSAFHAHKIGFSIKYSPIYGMLNAKKRFNPGKRIQFSKATLRVSKYYRTNTASKIILKAFITTLSVKYNIIHKKI